jgi:hypothetical protein
LFIPSGLNYYYTSLFLWLRQQKENKRRGCKIMNKRVTGEWIDGGYRHLFVLFLLLGFSPKEKKGVKEF